MTDANHAKNQSRVGAITKVGDGPWTIRVPAGLRVTRNAYTWTGTTTVALSDELLVAIRAFAAGDWPEVPDSFPDLSNEVYEK